jgi:hypothetical protein
MNEMKLFLVWLGLAAILGIPIAYIFKMVMIQELALINTGLLVFIITLLILKKS